MPKYFHSDVLDGGLLAIKNHTLKQMLFNEYSHGDDAYFPASVLTKTQPIQRGKA